MFGTFLTPSKITQKKFLPNSSSGFVAKIFAKIWQEFCTCMRDDPSPVNIRRRSAQWEVPSPSDRRRGTTCLCRSAEGTLGFAACPHKTHSAVVSMLGAIRTGRLRVPFGRAGARLRAGSPVFSDPIQYSMWVYKRIWGVGNQCPTYQTNGNYFRPSL